MKKRLYNVLIIILMLAISVIFVGCQQTAVVTATEDEEETVASVEEEVITYSKVSVYVTDENGEFIYSSVKKDTIQDNLADLLNKLKYSTYYFSLAMTDAGYGRYVKSYYVTEKIWIDGVATLGETTKYPITELEDGTIPEETEVVIYTSITDPQYLAIGHTATFNGVEYTAIGVSAGHMPMQDNAVYILTVEAL